jgi:GNAT superfamily N-acetyltransferase
MNQAITISVGWPEDLGTTAEFLNRNFTFDNIDKVLLREKLLDDPHPDPNLFLTAHNGAETTGIIYCVLRSLDDGLTGYVKLMAVDKKYHRKGIGTQLYKTAEGILIQKGVKRIRWYDVPLNYFMPGLDPRYTPALCFIESMGFQRKGEAINMEVDLNAMSWKTENEEIFLKSKGVEIRRAKIDDWQSITQFLNTEWKLWNYELEMAIKDHPPSLHLAFLNGQLKAFSAYNGNNKGTGWFGPMGTHADTRGLGIGSILLKRCLEDMRLQGHTKSTIPWVGPVSFYAHYVNASISRIFWRFEKQITG